ncbi:Xaa-Pro peptidase family protein [Candidatus Gracilibacteria bacterium]|nr:Xaa-Pro peptidase family protein [Candidatus Gracilibacteria bacterium]
MNFAQARLHHWLSRNDATDGFLVTKPENIFWLTGFQGSAGMYIQTKKGERILMTDSRYAEKAKQICENEAMSFLLLDHETREKFGEHFSGMFALEDSVSLARSQQLRKLFPLMTLQSYASILEQLRRQKNPDEIKKITIAQKQVDNTLLVFLQSHVRAGVSEKELSFKLEQALRGGGRFELTFPLIVAFGENSAIPHHMPTDRPLVSGDNILVDCGVKYAGYASDITRNFAFQRVSQEFQTKYELLRKVQNEALKQFQKGTPTAEIDCSVRSNLGADAVFFSHSLGHGVGLEVHELPRIAQHPPHSDGRGTPVAGTVLQKNEVVTCEPGIYYPGKFGIRIEDLLVIRKNGPDILSRTTKNLVILGRIH